MIILNLPEVAAMHAILTMIMNKHSVEVTAAILLGEEYRAAAENAAKTLPENSTSKFVNGDEGAVKQFEAMKQNRGSKIN